MNNETYVNCMKEDDVRKELIHLRNKLDELELDDYFGDAGWKYKFFHETL